MCMQPPVRLEETVGCRLLPARASRAQKAFCRGGGQDFRRGGNLGRHRDILKNCSLLGTYYMLYRYCCLESPHQP